MKTFEHSCYLCVVDQQFTAFLSDFMTAVAYLLWLLKHYNLHVLFKALKTRNQKLRIAELNIKNINQTAF